MSCCVMTKENISNIDEKKKKSCNSRDKESDRRTKCNSSEIRSNCDRSSYSGFNSGRRRESQLVVTMQHLSTRMCQQPLATLVFFASAVLRIAEACSSRSTPKPRPPTQSTRPNVTFPTFECPREYQSYYCLNGARCFTVKIENSVLYNCECTDGFTGPRCEYKDPDGSYLVNHDKVLIQTASIAGVVTFAVFVIVIVFITFYVYYKRSKAMKQGDETDSDRHLPFGPRQSSSHPMQHLSTSSIHYVESELPQSYSHQEPVDPSRSRLPITSTTTTTTTTTTTSH